MINTIWQRVYDLLVLVLRYNIHYSKAWCFWCDVINVLMLLWVFSNHSSFLKLQGMIQKYWSRVK